MPDWNSPAELQVEALAFLKLMHALAGVYFWEFVTSLDFDLSFVRGKKKFQWPMIFYFLGRYSLFFALIGILVALDATEEINCQALYTFNQLAGNAAMGFASMNLAIRTMAIWQQRLFIVIPLTIIILGHWALILQGVLLTAVWVPGTGCVITKTNSTILSATFIYTMCFDAVVLTLSAYNLFGKRGRSQIVSLLFQDGLIYFAIAFMSNLIATVFMVLDLNAIMSIIFNVPAVIASTTVACRAVRRLARFSSSGPEVYPSGGSGFRPRATTGTQQSISIHTPKDTNQVHVQMETFTVGQDDDILERKTRLHDTEMGAV